jgi:hypothetical protein
VVASRTIAVETVAVKAYHLAAAAAAVRVPVSRMLYWPATSGAADAALHSDFASELKPFATVLVQSGAPRMTEFV